MTSLEVIRKACLHFLFFGIKKDKKEKEAAITLKPFVQLPRTEKATSEVTETTLKKLILMISTFSFHVKKKKKKKNPLVQ